MKPEQFIREFGVDEAKRILERAPEDATHYRDLSCGTRYTKNVSETECYVWTNKYWRRSIVPYQIFTSEVIKPLSELKRLVESVELINLFGSIKIAKDKVKMADFNGFLLVSVPIENGLADVYIHKVEQAIRDHESIYGGGENA